MWILRITARSVTIIQMGMKFNEIKYRRRDLSRILLEKCKLSRTLFFFFLLLLFFFPRGEKISRWSWNTILAISRWKRTEGILPLETIFPSSDGNSSTTCVLQVHTNAFQRVWRMHSSAVRDLARFGYSRFDVSLDRRLTYRKYSRRLLPREFFPEEMEYLIEEEFLGGEIPGERHFLAYWILEDLFSNFPRILFRRAKLRAMRTR